MDKDTEIHELKTALFEIARITGADVNGEDTYKQLVFPDIITFATDAVTELRNDYDEALYTGTF